MKIYHFTNSYIEVFKQTKPKRTYSMASGKGVYFTTDYDKGYMKYGVKSKYCYVCEIPISKMKVLELGEFDSMYFDGRKIHSSSLVTENFRRKLQGVDIIPEPDIRIECLTTQAYNWLRKQGYQAIRGMDYWGYACPELVLIDVSCVTIKKILNL